MKYQIVATLGPATKDPQLWRILREAGASAFRLNTSHLSLDELEIWLSRLAALYSDMPGEELPVSVPVILDLQASKWRIGTAGGRRRPATWRLAAGGTVELVQGDSKGSGRLGSDGTAAVAAVAGGPKAAVLPVPHPDFFTAAASGGGEIVLNDARVILRIESAGSERITCRVVQGGVVSGGKGITIPGSSYRIERLNDRDLRVMALGQRYPFVRFALSYVKDSGEMDNYRRQFGDSSWLIAKLERASAIEEAERIGQTADELWICRGDLGAEMGIAAMAERLFRFSPKAIAKPVLLAGQVLEFMTEHPTPTRSEISYLYEALKRGFGGVVLSEETAVGAYPIESCAAAALFR
jgi:pyruvate kinase